MDRAKYDLEQRLMEYAARIIKVVESLPVTRVGNHIADQLLLLLIQIMAKHKLQNPEKILFIR